MTIDREKFSRAEDFLFGQMSPAERQKFETELGQNADLATEIELQKDEFEAMRGIAQLEMRKKMALWMTENPMQPPAETRVVGLAWLRPLALAATVALAVGAVGFGWAEKNYGSATLAESTFSTASSGLKSGDGEISPPFFEAKKAFAEGRFAESERLTVSITAENADFFKAQNLLAESLFEQKKWAAAAVVLQKQAAAAPSDFEKDLAEIRLAAAWLADGKGETEPFRQLLNKIADDPRHEFRARAADLRQKTQSFWFDLAN